MAEGPDKQVNARERAPGDENPTSEETPERTDRAAGDDEVEATRAEIEETRAEMTETIDALQDKLDPQKIKEQAKTRATSSVRDTGSRATETVKQNPAVPLAVGGGIALLLLLRSLLQGRRSQTVVLDLKKGRIRNS